MSRRKEDQIVSLTTRREFQESYVHFSVLRHIENDFEEAGITRGRIPEGELVSGERRTLVAEYYAGVDWTLPSDVRRVLDAYELHLLRLQEERYDTERDRLIAYLNRDRLPVVDGRIEFDAPEPHLDELVDTELGLDVSQLRVNIKRMRGAVEGDPELAIGSSKELVEATCKAILADVGEEPPAKGDISELVDCVAAHLDLLAAEVPEGKKGAKSIKRVLGSLSNVVRGLAELRNLYGTGHGKAPGRRGMSPRHARLAVGAAATLSLFLMETAVQRRDT